jgi:hypothetical protein
MVKRPRHGAASLFQTRQRGLLGCTVGARVRPWVSRPCRALLKLSQVRVNPSEPRPTCSPIDLFLPIHRGSKLLWLECYLDRPGPSYAEGRAFESLHPLLGSPAPAEDSGAGKERQALDFASPTLSSCATVALWPFVAIFASALVLVTALLVVVLVAWSLHDAPNYWRE